MQCAVHRGFVSERIKSDVQQKDDELLLVSPQRGLAALSPHDLVTITLPC